MVIGKIVPRVGQNGLKWIVVQDKWWGRKYLTRTGFKPHGCRIRLHLLTFDNPTKAKEKFIELYGTTARIEVWEG